MARLLARVLLVPASGVVVAGLWPVRTLEVVDLDADRLVALYPVARFQLRYRHSLYRGLVWEQFRLVGTDLVLDAVEAEQEAALEYYRFAQRVTRAGPRYRVTGLQQRLGELVVRATEKGERTLVVEGGELPLFAHGREGHRMRLRAVRVPAAWMAWGWLRARFLPPRGDT